MVVDSRRRWLVWIGPLVLWLGNCVLARGSDPVPPDLLDPAKGEINGRVAMAVVPARVDKGKLVAMAPWDSRPTSHGSTIQT
jgi:hypothetical protein